MAISDIVIANLTTLYLALIAGIKAFGLISGRSFSGGFVLVISTTIVGSIVVAALTWDLSRKATATATATAAHVFSGDSPNKKMCRGGICWHGVAVRSPASQLRFRLPHHHL